MMTEHALVIGKFYPPHSGHHLLIRTAARAARRVTVIAMAASIESIDLAERIAWLTAAHAIDKNVVVTGVIDDIAINYKDPAIWDAHVALMEQALRSIDAPKVSAVFTSEAYGHELARRFKAIPVVLDIGRGLAPISGSMVRADLAMHWHSLAPATRAGLAARIVVIGSESSGTTTLARALTTTLRERSGVFSLTQSVPEYGRDYTIEKLALARATAALVGQNIPVMTDLAWESEEFVQIAREQNMQEENAASLGSPVLICDTDAFATSIWHERYMGRRSHAVEAFTSVSARRLYLVTSVSGVPFEQDGLRDGEAMREWMQERFLARLAEIGAAHVVISGDPKERLRRSIACVDDFAARTFRFNPPLAET